MNLLKSINTAESAGWKLSLKRILTFCCRSALPLLKGVGEGSQVVVVMLSHLSAVVGCTAEQAMETSKLLFIKPQKKCTRSQREQHNGGMEKSVCVFSRVGEWVNEPDINFDFVCHPGVVC